MVRDALVGSSRTSTVDIELVGRLNHPSFDLSLLQIYTLLGAAFVHFYGKINFKAIDLNHL